MTSPGNRFDYSNCKRKPMTSDLSILSFKPETVSRKVEILLETPTNHTWSNFYADGTKTEVFKDCPEICFKVFSQEILIS